MTKWIFSFSATTGLSGLIAFSNIAAPISIFAKIFFFLLVGLFVISLINALVKKQWK